MTTRTLVRVSDGITVSRWRISSSTFWRSAASAVTPRRAGEAGAGDVAFEAVEVELQRLELELAGRRLERAGADDELGDQPRELVVARRAGSRSGARGGRAGRRRPGASRARRSSRRRRPRPAAARPRRAARGSSARNAPSLCSRRAERGARVDRLGRWRGARRGTGRGRRRGGAAVAAAAPAAVIAPLPRRGDGRLAAAERVVDELLPQPEAVGDELRRAPAAARSAASARSPAPPRRASRRCSRRAAPARARPRSARSARPRRAARASPPRPSAGRRPPGPARPGSRTIRNSTPRVVRSELYAAQRRDPARDRLLPRAVRVLAEQRLRRELRDRVICASVSAVPICATTSGTPAWCSAITSV